MYFSYNGKMLKLKPKPPNECQLVESKKIHPEDIVEGQMFMLLLVKRRDIVFESNFWKLFLNWGLN